MPRSAAFVTFTLAALVAPLPPAAFAEESGKIEIPAVLEQLKNSQPSFLVRAEVNRPDLTYREGDSMSLRVACEEDAYLYVFYGQADGTWVQLFPNRLQPDNHVKARQAVQVPGTHDMFRWVCTPPFGAEAVKVLATKKPLASAPAVPTRGRFAKVDAATFRGIALEIGSVMPWKWGEHDIVLKTYANNETPEESKAKRVGVFFGVAQHSYPSFKCPDDMRFKDQDGKLVSDWPNDLPECHRDAAKMADAMQNLGRLSETRVFTNGEATRANLEWAITQYLPSITRPGDTVFIFWAGHTGSGLADDGNEEPDGADEFLVPADCVPVSVFNAAVKAANDNTWSEFNQKLIDLECPPVDTKRYEKVLDLMQQAGDQATTVLQREMYVSDDTMARWLQRLEGRQVLFISDSCLSAGFAAGEKKFEETVQHGRAVTGRHANFLTDEIRQLGALGQKDQALLAAAHVNEESYGRDEADHGLLSYFVMEFLQQPEGGKRLEDAYEYVRGKMDEYQTSHQWSAEKTFHPFLMNNCQRPLYVKP